MIDDIQITDREKVNNPLHAIYLAQSEFVNTELVDQKKSREGCYLVKIGFAYDLPSRMISINTDLPYMRIRGWKFARFRPVIQRRLGVSEKASFERFSAYKLPWNEREKVAWGRNAGFELFAGGRDMVEQLLSEFTTRTVGHPKLDVVQKYCIDHLSPCDRVDYNRTSYENLKELQGRGLRDKYSHWFE